MDGSDVVLDVGRGGTAEEMASTARDFSGTRQDVSVRTVPRGSSGECRLIYPWQQGEEASMPTKTKTQPRAAAVKAGKTRRRKSAGKKAALTKGRGTAAMTPLKVVQKGYDYFAKGDIAGVTSVYADDRAFLTELALGIAPFNGRLLLGSEKISGQAMGPGTVLPQLLHGGPGRAGGGQELGAARGLEFYMQRTAIAGDKPIVDAILK